MPPSRLDLRDPALRQAMARLMESNRAEVQRLVEEEKAKVVTRPRRGRGEGSAEQRGPDKWRLRVFTGTDAKGRALQTSRTVRAKNKTEALRELRKFAREVEEGKVKSARGPQATVETLLEEWMKHQARTGKRPSTVDTYRSIADLHLIPALGALELRKVGSHIIDNYYAAKAEPGGGARPGKALSANTIRLHHAILSSAFSQAVKWGWIGTNPVLQATPPAEKRADRVAPGPELVRKLIDGCGDDAPLAMAITLGAITGCRRGELCGLQWGDVDWDHGTLAIVRQRQSAKGGDRTGPPKTLGPPISLGEGAIAMLRTYRRMVEEQAVELGVDIPDDGWLLSYDCGRSPLRANGLGEAISSLSKRSGVRITTHLLRYFAATQMVGAGVDPRTAAGRLRHSPEIMLRVYADFMPRKDLEAATGLEALVLSAGVVSVSDEKIQG